MTSKKNYDEVARIISINKLNTFENLGFSVISRDGLINGLYVYFKHDNPRFDKKRFLLACSEDDEIRYVSSPAVDNRQDENRSLDETFEKE